MVNIMSLSGIMLRPDQRVRLVGVAGIDFDTVTDTVCSGWVSRNDLEVSRLEINSWIESVHE